MRPRQAAFTIVELLVVMAIILVLAGLVLGTSGYVHSKAARSRAEAEINALSAALENYKADNGIYPQETSTNAQNTYDPTMASYKAGSFALYKALSGDTDGDRVVDAGAKSYFTFKDSQLYPATTAVPNKVQYIQDPFGYCYGYSTLNSTDATKGYNPTFDLWSTSGSITSPGQVSWVKNW